MDERPAGKDDAGAGEPWGAMNGWGEQAEDRRRHRRYEIGLELRYVVRDPEGQIVRGHGRTCNMSSNGILFRSSRPPVAGCAIEAVVKWPSVRKGLRQRELVVVGQVARQSGDLAAIRVIHHQFRFVRSYLLPRSVSGPEPDAADGSSLVQ